MCVAKKKQLSPHGGIKLYITLTHVCEITAIINQKRTICCRYTSIWVLILQVCSLSVAIIQI